MANPDGSHTLITGASSGLGAALARQFARKGSRIDLWGRDAERLAAVAQDCAARGADTRTVQTDLADTGKALQVLQGQIAERTPDLAILNAGIGDMVPAGAAVETAEDTTRLAAVNFGTTAVLANELANAFITRGSGTLVLISSHAAYAPLPQAPVYSASKAAVSVQARGLQIALRRTGVQVLLVSPGFIDTPMSRRLNCMKPFILTADEAAVRIARAIARRKRHLILSWPLYAVTRLGGALPFWLQAPILSAQRVEQRAQCDTQSER